MEQRDPAMARFWVMQGLRLSGVILVLLGALIVAGRIDLPEVAGFILLVVGAVDFFVVPLILAKRWKTRP